MKKLFAVLVALTLVLSMGTIALAADGTAPTGTITIENAVKDYDYTVYKMLNFVPSNEAGDKGIYTIADGWDSFIKGTVGSQYFDVDANGTVTKKAEPDANLAREAVDFAKTIPAGTGFKDTKKAEATTVVFENLALGYYAVDTTVGAICSLTNTNSDEKLIEKNELPTLEKKIVEGEALVDANNAAINGTVDYQIKITIGKGLTDYVVRDTMSAGLTYKGDAKAYLVDANGSLTEIAEGNYTVTTTANGFDVAFKTEYTNTVEGATIVIKFSATLDTDAVIGSTGNPNTAKLDYKNENEVVSTPDDTVITYTTKLTIDKFETVDGKKIPLKGADFTLYKGDEVIGNKTITDGTKFEWTGLEAGVYTLKETTVPTGYNKAKDITFEIKCDVPEVVDAATNLADWTVTGDGVTETIVDAVEMDIFEGEIENKTGTLLPETGGIGTTIFYIVGITLMLGAAIVLISKKRMASFA